MEWKHHFKASIAEENSIENPILYSLISLLKQYFRLFTFKYPANFFPQLKENLIDFCPEGNEIRLYLFDSN